MLRFEGLSAFVLDAMPVNAAFQSALSNDIVTYPPELWVELRFRILDDPICYELWVISIATGTSMRCYSPKSFPSFKASLELYFSRIMHVHMLQRLFSRPLFSPTHATFSFTCLFAGYVAY
ncbi:transposable element Tcb1 transposase [Trichonephila clavipes]|nr:transposable element Tcb1 transposase [Trichonephila clavipes]